MVQTAIIRVDVRTSCCDLLLLLLLFPAPAVACYLRLLVLSCIGDVSAALCEQRPPPRQHHWLCAEC